jgi:hypothetical protein
MVRRRSSETEAATLEPDELDILYTGQHERMHTCLVKDLERLSKC